MDWKRLFVNVCSEAPQVLRVPGGALVGRRSGRARATVELRLGFGGGREGVAIAERVGDIFRVKDLDGDFGRGCRR